MSSDGTRPSADPRRTAKAGASRKATPTPDLPAWESLGDGYWLPQRVRGSNRGRALG